VMRSRTWSPLTITGTVVNFCPLGIKQVKGRILNNEKLKNNCSYCVPNILLAFLLCNKHFVTTVLSYFKTSTSLAVFLLCDKYSVSSVPTV
jgi:hypothetical protein